MAINYGNLWSKFGLTFYFNSFRNDKWRKMHAKYWCNRLMAKFVYLEREVSLYGWSPYDCFGFDQTSLSIVSSTQTTQ